MALSNQFIGNRNRLDTHASAGARADHFFYSAIMGGREGLIPDDPINLRLYKKEFAAGLVTLGGNWAEQAAGIRSHYLVVVASNDQE